MRGIELKKNDNQKRKQNIKLIICLLSSNLLLFLLFSFFGEKTETKIISEIPKRPFHIQHKKLALELELKIVFSPEETEIPVAIYSENKKLLIPKAFLHPEINSKNESKLEDGEGKKMIVEIPDEKIETLIAYQGEKLIAYPAPTILAKQKQVPPQGETYEISF